MNSGTTPSPAAPASGNAVAFWPRFRATFGPAVVGLFGGALTVGIACAALLPVLQNVAATYAKYPSLDAPWPAGDFTLPGFILLPLVCLGVAAPFGLGLATAGLARPKDQWEAVSAGLTTAATASAVAYVLWIGWVVTLATVVVPSIADLTLLGHSIRTPAEATAHPSDMMTAPYPDLKGAPADERGELFFPKIVSDQVVGSAYGVWFGVAVAVASVGVPGFCGTLAATWLLRRGGSWRSVLLPYTELTFATAVPLGLLTSGSVAFGFAFGQPMGWLQFAALAAVSAVVVAGVIGRWDWPLRLTTAAGWVLVLIGAGFEGRVSAPTTYAAYGVYGGLALLLLRQWSSRSAGQPPVESATRLVMPPK